MTLDRFTIARDGKRWAILLDGQPYVANGIHYCHYKRKCDALGAIPAIVQRLEYEARLTADDRDGVYRWTVDEEANIQEYAEVLKANKERFTMSGKRTPEAIARGEHESDARCIESWHAPVNGGKDNFICIELRRRRAARVLAFERAGLKLDRNRYDLHYSRISREFKSYFTYDTREEAEATMQDIVKRGAEFGENDYVFQISEARFV